MNEKIKKYYSKVLWVALIIFVIRCFIAIPKSLYDLYGCMGETISITAIFMYCYNKWLWRYIPIEKTPVLYKEYRGVFKSSYDDIEHEAIVQIKQTLLTIQVIVTTGESKSKSISCSIEEVLGENQLTYCYLNTPNAGVRSRSEVHYGTAMLCVDNPIQLKGQYFTDRKTTGDIVFNAEIKPKKTSKQTTLSDTAKAS